MYLAIIIGGMLLVVLAMALVINPPEAWIKKAFHRSPVDKDSTGRNKSDR